MVVHTDKMLEKHTTSYLKSQHDAINNYDLYQSHRNLLDTDFSDVQEKIIHLQDSIPFKFTILAMLDNCLYFSFLTNYDLNPKGTMMIEFSASKKIVIYISNVVKRPNKKTAQKILYKSGKFDPTEGLTHQVTGQQICYLTI